MELGNSKAALLAFAKTIEHLVEDNLILNDPWVIGYEPLILNDSCVIGHGQGKICSDVEAEKVSISFQSRGFAETFKKEYNRRFVVKETDAGFEVTKY